MISTCINYDNRQKIPRMKDLLFQFDLEQCVLEHTHRSGHILDWIKQRQSDPLATSASVRFDLTSDRMSMVSGLNVDRPCCAPHFIVRINIRAICRSPADPDRPCTHLSAHEYNTHLKSLLDKHAP